ncbi:MAG: hypothetical protein ACJAVR_001039 [Paracoccaceae bacterium]|jgi:hypothetical protein
MTCGFLQSNSGTPHACFFGVTTFLTLERMVFRGIGCGQASGCRTWRNLRCGPAWAPHGKSLWGAGCCAAWGLSVPGWVAARASGQMGGLISMKMPKNPRKIPSFGRFHPLMDVSHGRN